MKVDSFHSFSFCAGVMSASAMDASILDPDAQLFSSRSQSWHGPQGHPPKNEYNQSGSNF